MNRRFFNLVSGLFVLMMGADASKLNAVAAYSGGKDILT